MELKNLELEFNFATKTKLNPQINLSYSDWVLVGKNLNLNR